jgi:cytoskeleton protein RodZ
MDTPLCQCFRHQTPKWGNRRRHDVEERRFSDFSKRGNGVRDGHSSPSMLQAPKSKMRKRRQHHRGRAALQRFFEAWEERVGWTLLAANASGAKVQNAETPPTPPWKSGASAPRKRPKVNRGFNPCGPLLGHCTREPNAAEVTFPLTSRPVARSPLLSYHGFDTTLAGSVTVGELGKKFRKARESKQLSLEDVSNVTKIGSRMLQAIEEEDFERLPGGVFNKGFIRAYAKHLGLDSEDAVNEYLDCLRQAQVDSQQVWDSSPRIDPRAKAAVATKTVEKARASTQVEEELPHLHLPRAEHVRTARKEYLGRPSPEIPWTPIYVAAIIVIAAAFLWLRHSHSVHNAAANSAASVSASPAPTRISDSSASPPSGANSTAAQRPAAPPAALHANVPAGSNPSTPASNQPKEGIHDENQNQVKVEKKDDVTIRSFGASTPQPTEPAAANLSLIIRASENSWVSVTSDGQVVTQETLIAPAHPKFHAAREFVVRVGNAAGITFIWNGQELPPQGAESEAKTFVFDAQGMRVPGADTTTH